VHGVERGLEPIAVGAQGVDGQAPGGRAGGGLEEGAEGGREGLGVGVLVDPRPGGGGAGRRSAQQGLEGVHQRVGIGPKPEATSVRQPRVTAPRSGPSVAIASSVIAFDSMRRLPRSDSAARMIASRSSPGACGLP
jgi:hypothetical protein